MIYLKQFTSVEELYNRKGEPTGEIIIDAVIEALRSSVTSKSEDIALLLDVDHRALWFGVQLLTGLRLKDFVQHWRVLQAKELWDAKSADYNNYREFVKTKKKEAPEGFSITPTEKHAFENEVSIKSLEEVAKRCGWDSYKSLLRVAKKFGISFEVKRFVNN